MRRNSISITKIVSFCFQCLQNKAYFEVVRQKNINMFRNSFFFIPSMTAVVPRQLNYVGFRCAFLSINVYVLACYFLKTKRLFEMKSLSKFIGPFKSYAYVGVELSICFGCRNSFVCGLFLYRLHFYKIRYIFCSKYFI